MLGKLVLKSLPGGSQDTANCLVNLVLRTEVGPYAGPRPAQVVGLVNLGLTGDSFPAEKVLYVLSLKK